MKFKFVFFRFHDRRKEAIFTTPTKSLLMAPLIEILFFKSNKRVKKEKAYDFVFSIEHLSHQSIGKCDPQMFSNLERIFLVQSEIEKKNSKWK